MERGKKAKIRMTLKQRISEKNNNLDRREDTKISKLERKRKRERISCDYKHNKYQIKVYGYRKRHTHSDR